MPKIAIIGNAGGGKSKLAKRLGEIYQIPVYEFDHLQWKPGWSQTSDEEIWSVHRQWLKQSDWVIEGWGSWKLLEERFDNADILVFVDLSLMVHYWWSLKRQIKAIFGRSEGWPPAGCRALPVTGRLLRLIWLIHKEKRPVLYSLIQRYQGIKKVVHLQSPRELKSWIQEME